MTYINPYDGLGPIIPRILLRQSKLSPGAKIVLVVLKQETHLDPNDDRGLAKACGMSVKTFRRYFNEVVKFGNEALDD